ncbi:MAG: phage holin family protein [Melioribacteraceae bacterium]|jgi:toxin secretion/phage lysis holin|nr:phage holin family protein [Melioribacteraceae bacterium]
MNNKIFNGLSVFSALLGSVLGWFLGGLDGLLLSLIVFVIIDYVTGVMLAIIEKKISSKIGSRGIAKKVAIFALVGIANVIDINIISNGNAIRGAVILFYISNEGISILENVAKMDLPIPEKLKSILKQVSGESKK